MIIRHMDNRLRLVTQVDHGTLAGELVGHWGNDRFAAPTPPDSVHLAATLHDEGWRVYDQEPLYNEEEKRPLSFAEIDQHIHVPLYQSGVDAVYRQDTYAGLLVSMHMTGLYRARWGLQPFPINWETTNRTPVEQLQDDAVTEQEHLWVDAKRELYKGIGFRSDFEVNLWHNFDMLQAFDLLSIYVCINDHNPSGADEPQLLGMTLRTLDQRPGARLIPNVPTAPGRERADLVLRAVEPGIVTVDPYPFSEDEIEVSIPGVSIPDGPYASQAEVHDAVAGGDRVTATCRMVRRGNVG